MANDHPIDGAASKNTCAATEAHGETARQRLAVNLRVLRMLRGWSQEDLAEAAQVDRSYVGGIERAERSTGLDCLERLAGAFDLTIPDLLQPMDAAEIGKRLVDTMRSKAAR